MSVFHRLRLDDRFVLVERDAPSRFGRDYNRTRLRCLGYLPSVQAVTKAQDQTPTRGLLVERHMLTVADFQHCCQKLIRL